MAESTTGSDSVQMTEELCLQPGDKLFVFEERTAHTPKPSQLLWVELSAAYKNAADSLADAAIKQERNECGDLYPIVFLYRHFIELELKSLVALSLIHSSKEKLVEYAEKILGGHNPERLLDCLTSNLEDLEYLRESAEFTVFKLIVKELTGYDPSSTAFRYSVTKALDPTQVNLHGLSITNLRNVAQRFAQTCLFLRSELQERADGYSDSYDPGPQMYRVSDDEMLSKELDGRMQAEAKAEEFDADWLFDDDRI
jgi:hypothetical protein